MSLAMRENVEGQILISFDTENIFHSVDFATIYDRPLVGVVNDHWQTDKNHGDRLRMHMLLANRTRRIFLFLIDR